MDFPYGIVQSKNDFYLKGDVKNIFQINYIEKTNPEPSISYRFNKNGLIERIEGKGHGGSLMKMSLKNNRLEKVIIFHGSYGDKDNSTSIESIDYDAIGRAIKLKSRRTERNGLVEVMHPTEITIISYGKNSQEQKTYTKDENNIELSGTKFIEFDNDGLIIKLCRTWKKIPACESGDTLEFSRNGPIHYRSMLGHKTEFTYENGFVSKETLTSLEKIITSIRYYDYKVDNCGNWIERKLGDKTDSYLLEKREIEYFNKCNNG